MTEKTESSVKFNVSDIFSGLFWALVLLIYVAGTDMTLKERHANPYSFGAAIGCRVGGPSFCPAGHP